MIDTQKQLAEALEELADLVDLILAGQYRPDSFTTQPARAAHRQQEARGPLTDAEADSLTAPFLVRVLGSSNIFVEQARELVRTVEAAHGIKGE